VYPAVFEKAAALPFSLADKIRAAPINMLKGYLRRD
jgi:hypothetical protein